MARRRFWWLVQTLAAALCLLVFTSLRAATNSELSEQIPALAPPRGEIPPSFWEQYGNWVLASGVVLLAAVGAAMWFLNRPKPPVILPPEVQARQALEILSQGPEDGTVLSQVSQVLRHYVAAAFGLPAGELTTTEFCRLIGSHSQVGPELAAAISGFLRQCDERKFAPSPLPAALGAVPRALELIEISQTRRAQLREAARAKAVRPEPVAVRLFFLILIFALILTSVSPCLDGAGLRLGLRLKSGIGSKGFSGRATPPLPDALSST